MSNLINQDKFQSQLTINEKNENLVHGGLRLKNIFKKKKNHFLISIITVVFNGEKYLEETIKSVINQTNKNFEYIIVDGGSTDRTLDIIKKYDQQIDYWISQEDKGIYDAFNKGLKLVSGDVIGIVNSDDTYNNECFEIVKNYFKKNDNLDFLFGGVKKKMGYTSWL